MALQRLDEGTYGICIDCGEDIPAERLEAIPEAIRCIDDQKRYDAELRAAASAARTVSAASSGPSTGSR